MRHFIVAFVALASAPAFAADTWSTPFAGAELLHRVTGSQDAWLLRVDLCAAGVDVRATASGEKGRTVGSFSNLVGAKAAINGDFFNGSFGTDGPSMHAGAQWGGSDHNYVAPVAFGNGFVDIPNNNNTNGPAAGAREVVSGHPTLLDDGGVVGNPGNPLCSNRHPRTAIGVTANHTKLILAVVDGRRTGAAGMTCPEIASFLSEHGAFDAVNMDGGGSSTLVVNGGVKNHPSDGSQRTVANHLAIVDAGGANPLCPNTKPRGYLDSVTCEGGAVGWAQDLDTPEETIDVHLYVDGPALVGQGYATTADVHRDNLCTAIGSCVHGFAWALPPRTFDGVAHTVHAYAIDSDGGNNPQLSGAQPLSFTCTAPAPPIAPGDGVKRHVTSPDSLAAWKQTFDDVYPLAEDVVASFDEVNPWAEAPRLVRTDGNPAVYFVDTLDGVEVLRHVTSPASMTAWRFSFGDIEELPNLDAFTIGHPLPDAPFLFRGAGFAVYVLDAAVPVVPDEPGDIGTPDGAPGDDTNGDGVVDADDGALPPSIEGGCGATAAPFVFALLALLRVKRTRARVVSRPRT